MTIQEIDLVRLRSVEIKSAQLQKRLYYGAIGVLVGCLAILLWVAYG